MQLIEFFLIHGLYRIRVIVVSETIGRGTCYAATWALSARRHFIRCRCSSESFLITFKNRAGVLRVTQILLTAFITTALSDILEICEPLYWVSLGASLNVAFLEQALNDL